MLPGTVGLIMATEAIKLVLGIGEPLRGRLLLYDSLKMRFKEVRIRQNPSCDLCGESPSIKQLVATSTPAEAEPASSAPGELEVSARALKELLDSGAPITLLDVREPHEWELARIERARLTPLSQLESHIPQLSRAEEIYLYCYKGQRSLRALKTLREHGFTNLKSLTGGIDQWSVEVDPSVPRY